MISRAERLVTMKVLVGESTIPDKRKTWDELGMLKTIREKSLGYHHIRQLLDNLTHQGPNGNQICLVLEAMNLSVLDISCLFWPHAPQTCV
jgi:serine/threonine-protein kinase SRPK3